MLFRSGIVSSLILEKQRGSLQNTDQPSPVQKVEAFSNVVQSLGSGNTSFSLQSNMLVATPPSIPTPSLIVAGVLQDGGANRIDPTQLIKVQV